MLSGRQRSVRAIQAFSRVLPPPPRMGSGNADENTELITKGVVQEIDPATGLPAMAPDVVENGVSKTMWIFIFLFDKE